MIPPSFANAALSLIVLIGILVGISYLLKKTRLVAYFVARHGPPAIATSRAAVKIDRLRRLSIIELGGHRFALLTGRGADQLVLIDRPTDQDRV